MNKKVLYHFNQLYEFDENLTNPLTQRNLRAIIYVRLGKRPQKKEINKKKHRHLKTGGKV
jgi:hypothetical protein